MSLETKILSQQWYEFRDLRGKTFNRAVWVPLKSSKTLNSRKEYGEVGWVDETLFAESIMVPSEQAVDLVQRLHWSDFNVGWSNKPYVSNDIYFEAGTFTRDERSILGRRLVLEQHLNPAHQSIWYLLHDFVLAYDLVKEGDDWLASNEGYVPVVKESNVAGEREIAVRAEFLRDYLCARNSALLVATYRSRSHITTAAPEFSWDDGGLEIEDGFDSISCRQWKVLQGDGSPLGAKVASFRMWRTDVDEAEDVPLMGPETGDNVGSESHSFERTGASATRIEGEFWHKEVIEPGAASFRLRNDPTEIRIDYIVEADGSRMSSADLRPDEIGRWLWFKPQVMNAILALPNTGLEWYTRQTGAIFACPGNRMWFGVNDLGLITVYASDIARAPE
ncbi:hypothetical protein [Henriciella marina]|uniref:Minor tail protein n=1 Tax=Henriciella marina TaxID=453851 RepID=A0ABT4LQL6_9PROT|nr:hypothetical protein [Henriciella marina]MCZ4296662.1 hypothetical protein [Henriciella marina]